ncbi:hypothetical protein KBTX_02535 [wastewater metagenome]|uniref:Glycosyltransferase 2-like domain-containing protein n=2 Tax=unclassified sequences TaxID=12908 RepID=A0A5B8RH46_9ZZZZ|nr:glycosyltransferase [Arhodomonas sp. KWT]QEA06205.1 hypothetical protein KBTEX_02535 [uncultured organism]
MAERSPDGEAVLKMVVPTFRRPERLERLLKAVAGLIGDFFAVAVIDDSSGPPWDDRYLMLKKTYPNVEWYFQDKNCGGGAARNIGFKNGVRARWVWFFDDDDYVAAQDVKKLMAYLVECRHEKLVLLSAVIVNGCEEACVTPKGESLFERFSSVGHQVNTSCAIFDAGLLRDVGGWDENLVSGQDTDIFLRASEYTNARVFEEIYVTVYHHNDERITADPRRQMRGKRQFLMKNWRRLAWRRRLRYGLTYALGVPYLKRILGK